MSMLRYLALIVFSAYMVAQAPIIRIGIDTTQNEYLFSFEDGGVLQSLEGVLIRSFTKGERFRIWIDSAAQSKVSDEYRIQINGPLNLDDANQLIDQLKNQGFVADKVIISDSEFYRVLVGRFRTTSQVEKDFDKLKSIGYEELWISSERNLDLAKSSESLYLITQRYERILLPSDGVSLRSLGLTTQIINKGKYRGLINVVPHYSGRLSIVNVLDIETYLRGVVPREMGPSEFPDIEALKAQSIAARTYAIANLNKRIKEGFDLNDTIADQVYGGYDAEQPMTDQAIEGTRGVIASYEGKPIQALFMANAGGSTIDVGEVFGGNAPYLKGVSTYFSDVPHLSYTSSSQYPQILQSHITESQLRLLIGGLVTPQLLVEDKLNSKVDIYDAQSLLEKIQKKLELYSTSIPQEPLKLLGVARAFGFDRVMLGQDRIEDAAYIFGNSLDSKDSQLAYFLLRRNLATYRDLTSPNVPDWKTYLNWVYLFWNELAPFAFQEGTLLRTDEVRKRREEPQKINLNQETILGIELPGNYYQLVSNLSIPAGDRLRWIVDEQGRVTFAIHRKDPDGISLDRFHPDSHWKQDYSESDLLGLIRQRVPIKEIQSIEIKHNQQGRVIRMTIRDQNKSSYVFTGMRIRNLLRLKDNVFSMITSGKGAKRRWIFYGRGWGHGVGLSQTAAYGMALTGRKYDEILKHFYSNIQLTTLY